MTLTLGFSPCPNDTFIFDALVNHHIDTGGLDFDVYLEDVQTLNRWAMEGRLDLSKISYGVLPLITGTYEVLQSGGALGKGVGPLLISKTPVDPATIEHKTIAIPGENTTAHMLFSLAYPKAKHKRFVLFSDIERMVLEGETDLGVIIHENRFTYQQKGLVKLADLGQFWEETTGNPIPLGGIVAKRSLEPALVRQVDELIRRSVAWSFDRYPGLSAYIREHAQEMDETVMRQHIDLYVNDFSRALGAQGEKAVEKLLEVYTGLHPDTALHQPVFIR
ncbi:1,4-dihydroxy-6-naphthoate synthase [Dinghuibacter silviterrae]|uniref:1,4-dihydroxy-6-naphtoate synthase n=1 Tax=Dinghuibacter silviterrae TaxID=1539049 RepID=A0A4R8DE58_9BACT|nr:1,4-dihydroxy-6-naphthoate synthase [Dinghuibacter silviterrae]TDW95695.1 1,4-dihydroxy-6-naphthoate synthase [Dinghuibacter silviterrae]